MTEPLLRLRGISKSFAGVKALDSVDLDIMPGEVHCLAGENGSGKSTVIKIISGVYNPDPGGEITLDGTSFTHLSPIEAISGGVQVIYQDFSVFPNLTVAENLALTGEVSNGRKLVKWRRMRAIAEEAVKKVNFHVDLDARVGDLSVADKQLVAISRALITDPKLLIMDEPTTALTHREVEALFRVVADLKARGISILFVSHKLEEVFEISERFTILRNGTVVTTTVPAELNHRTFAEYMTGRDYDDSSSAPATEPGEPVLEVSGLCLKDAFDDVSFTLRRGEVLGITGLLGSGRTELALTLFGVFPQDAGEMKVSGKPVRLRGIRDAIANGIGYVPEDRLTEGLMLERSIADNIVISELDSLSRLGVLDRSRRAAEVKRWVEELKIATRRPSNPVNTLSGGNQQRVVIAKWLATQPDVLILNGPTVGVDIGSKRDIHRILKDLAEQRGMGIVVITDDIPELLQVSNRVLLLKEGRITDEVDPASVTELEMSAMIMGGSISGEVA